MLGLCPECSTIHKAEEECPMDDRLREPVPKWAAKVMRDQRAENERLREALQAWEDACTVDALMSGPVVRVSHHKAQAAWKTHCEALNQRKD